MHLDPASGDVTIHATADHDTPYVYLLQATARPERCAPGEPLALADIAVYRVAPGDSFNVYDWRGTGGLAYSLAVKNGELQSSRGAVY